MPEAVVNFIALLGWSPHTAGQTASSIPAQFNPQELFSLDELVERFSLEGLNKRPVMISEKLAWMNKQHFKRKLRSEKDLEQLAVQLQEELQKQLHHQRRLVVHSESICDYTEAVCRVQRSHGRAAKLYLY